MNRQILPTSIQIVNPLDLPDWDAFIGNFSESTIFHSAAWARVLIESYGFVPHYCITRQGEKISGILPLMEVRGILWRKKAVSLPFTDFCEPLFSEPDDFHKVFRHLTAIAPDKKWRSIELRGGEQYLAGEPAYDTMYTHEINLAPEPDAIFKSFSDTTRRNIRKAEKSGVTISHENSLDAMKSFYYLNCLTRREHGLPPQPWRFFVNLHAQILAKEKGFITIASYSGKTIAANFYLKLGKNAIYKYGASDRHYQHLRPSNLVMWEGIKNCKSLDAVSLNLGRTEKHHKGLRQFKLGFGCSEKTVNYYRFAPINSSFLKGDVRTGGQIANKFFRIMPVVFLRMVGHLLYKYAG